MDEGEEAVDVLAEVRVDASHGGELLVPFHGAGGGVPLPAGDAFRLHGELQAFLIGGGLLLQQDQLGDVDIDPDQTLGVTVHSQDDPTAILDPQHRTIGTKHSKPVIHIRAVLQRRLGDTCDLVPVVRVDRAEPALQGWFGARREPIKGDGGGRPFKLLGSEVERVGGDLAGFLRQPQPLVGLAKLVLDGTALRHVVEQRLEDRSVALVGARPGQRGKLRLQFADAVGEVLSRHDLRINQANRNSQSRPQV
ncbi:hypothetical protein M8312_12995 [Sphingomonas sp. KRR8]|uniref:hypothetical protein n=1 Tax=Sphingomonas sp. KRR8 TaxID=2942996 RepID=UPI002021E012|nr:hypothetical protein [Sphingomonas sp. KRR8]URD60679.1 hypothetical protein M8312_12995 [Sphingomonas sp. KRR8]